MNTVPVCAVLPTQLTRAEIFDVLESIHGCDPLPAEVCVHINEGAEAPVVAEAEIIERFPGVRLTRSQENLGPGGARNLLIRASRQEWIASFDDDSHPIDKDYFARVAALFGAYPEAAVLSAAVFHRGEEARPALERAYWVWNFVGCGCAYRRSMFLATKGYIVRGVAYMVEEVDLCVQLMANRDRVLHTEWLRVRHDTRLAHHSDSPVTAGALANVALAGWVRYPASALWRVPFQVANRLWFSVRRNRWAGLAEGLLSIPALLWRHRNDRHPVPGDTLRRFLRERSLREPAPWRLGSHSKPA